MRSTLPNWSLSAKRWRSSIQSWPCCLSLSRRAQLQWLSTRSSTLKSTMTSTLMASSRDMWSRRIITSRLLLTRGRDLPCQILSHAKPSLFCRLTRIWKLWLKKLQQISFLQVILPTQLSVCHRLAILVVDTSCQRFWDLKLLSSLLVKRTLTRRGTRIRRSSYQQRQSTLAFRQIIEFWTGLQSLNSHKDWSSWSRTRTWCCSQCTEII